MNKDLISRQDAIKEVSKYVHSVDMIIGNCTLSMAGCMDVAEEILEGLPSMESEPKWIPCSERLPKEKQSVLVTDGSVIWVCDIISTDEGYKWEDSHGYWLDLDEWIAWMSLPKFYNGGGDAE